MPSSAARIGSLFSGYGGLDMATQAVLGGRIAWHVDNDTAAQQVLADHWPNVPNHGDVSTVDWTNVAPVDVLAGGFPCQDISTAGNRAGLAPDSRSGLWTHMARAVHMLRPRVVVIENVGGLLGAEAHCDVEPCPWCVGDQRGRSLRALGAVLGDLAVLRYDAQWCGLRAADVGAPHGRFRVFLVATNTNQQRPQGAEPTAGRNLSARCATANAESHGRHQRRSEPSRLIGGSDVALGDSACCIDWGNYTPAIERWGAIIGRDAPEPTCIGHRGQQVLAPEFVEWLMGLEPGHVTAVNGLTRVDQLRLLGNGVIPLQASTAITHLLDNIPNRGNLQ